MYHFLDFSSIHSKLRKIFMTIQGTKDLVFSHDSPESDTILHPALFYVRKFINFLSWAILLLRKIRFALYHLLRSILKDDSRHTKLISCIQGPAVKNDFDLMINLTKTSKQRSRIHHFLIFSWILELCAVFKMETRPTGPHFYVPVCRY